MSLLEPDGFKENAMKALWCGLPNFSVGAAPHEGGWILRVRTRDAAVRSDLVDPSLVLSWLAKGFERFSGPFSGVEADPAALDFRRWGMPLVVRRDGLRIDLLVDGRPPQVETRESVLVVESVLTLGTILMEIGADVTSAEMWRKATVSCLLFAAAPEDGSFSSDPVETERLARWSAAGLGHRYEDYLLAAEWLTARQRLFAVKALEAEPSPQEWSAERIPELPEAEVVAEMVEKAAAAFDESPADLREEALAMRNIDARQLLVFRRFYGPVFD